MNNNYKNLGIDIAIFTIGTIGAKLILFLLVPLYTNILSKNEYGTCELVLTIAQLIMPCISLTIYDAVLRFSLIKEKKREDVIYSALIIFIFGCVGLIFLTPLLYLYKPINNWIIHLILYIIVSFTSTTLLLYLKAKNLNKFYSILCIIQAITLILFNIIFLVLLKTSISGYLWSNILSCAIISILAFIIGEVKKDLQNGKRDYDLIKEMILYSGPLVINSISWWVIHSSDKIMIESILGSSMLGLYTIATKIPSLLNVVTSIFNQAWGLASIKEFESTNDKNMYSNIFNIFAIIVFSSFVGICLILKIFMKFYVGEEFFESWKYVPILLLSACFAAFAAFWGSMYSAIKKSKNVMLTTLIAGIFNILINFLLIPRIGIQGATIGTLIAYIVITIIRMIDINKYIMIDYKLKKFIPLSFHCVIIAIIYSFDLQSFNNIVILVIIFILIVYKDYLKFIKMLILLFK